jgi:hypothetical protein
LPCDRPVELHGLPRRLEYQCVLPDLRDQYLHSGPAPGVRPPSSTRAVAGHSTAALSPPVSPVAMIPPPLHHPLVTTAEERSSGCRERLPSQTTIWVPNHMPACCGRCPDDGPGGPAWLSRAPSVAVAMMLTVIMMRRSRVRPRVTTTPLPERSSWHPSPFENQLCCCSPSHSRICGDVSVCIGVTMKASAGPQHPNM